MYNSFIKKLHKAATDSAHFLNITRDFLSYENKSPDGDTPLDFS